MPLLVQKYGGTSVGSVERIHNVAARVLKARAEGHDLIVIVSAMAGETDRLLKLAGQVNPEPDPRELDVLLATGEQVSIALLALAVQRLGGRAKSFFGPQIGIQTDSAHTRARIQAVNPERVTAALAAGYVAIVAGFQGTTPEGGVSTLGRGGSDTTAVALAARLAAKCEIYTDVEGIYTADPRLVPEARLLPRVSHDEIIEMSSSGAKVMETRSVLFAKRYDVPVEVRSSLSDRPGTLICSVSRTAASGPVTGLTSDANEAQLTFDSIPHQPGTAGAIFGPLAERGINADMIIQSAKPGGSTTSLSFTVREPDLAAAAKICQETAAKLGGTLREPGRGIVKLSAVGAGMRTQTGVAAAMFEALASEGVNIEMINTSEIRVSCLIRKDGLEAGLRALHRQFGLEKPCE